MIDLKSELQDYRKINLEEIAASGQEISDVTRNSILLYNKAVDSLANGSEDIAMIELKKAVSINPNFYEALNLLGICYSHINDNDKAAEIFDRVVKGESNGVKAQKYLGIVKSTEQDAPKAGTARKRAPSSPSFSSLQSRTAAKKSSIRDRNMNILRCAVCFIAGALLIGIISLAVHKPDTKIPDTSIDANNSATQQLKDYKAKYEELDSNYNVLKNDLENANKKVDYFQSAIKLYEVESLAAGKQYEKAADMLILLKTVEYTGEDIDRFNKLNTEILPKAASTVYTEGINLYNGRKYEEAIKKLEKVQLYSPDYNKNDAVLYNLGKSYQQLNDSRNAVAAYQKLIDTYPGSAYAKRAKDRISKLTEIP